MPNINIINDNDEFKLLINDLPHVYICKNIGFELIGFQSWIESNTNYCIEYYIRKDNKDSNILTSYDTKELWENILNKLKNINFGTK